MMRINTTRFGSLEIRPEEILTFPTGLLGLEGCRHWVLLSDAQNEALAWLQSTKRPEIAVAVVNPQRFVADFQLRAARTELAPLELATSEQAQVLVIVGKNDHGVTLNLKAPLVINPSRRLGRQVINSGDLSLAYELTSDPPALKKSA